MRSGARRGAISAACCAAILALLVPASALAADDPTEPPIDPFAPTIQYGVTIAGQDVGGLTAKEAVEAVRGRFERSLQLVVSKTWKQRFMPAQLGARARIGKAVESALSVQNPGVNVPLTVEVDDGVLRRLLARLGRETARDPIDSRFLLVRKAPFATRSQPGRRLKELTAFYALRLQLRKHDRTPYQLPFDDVEPAVTEDDLGKAIVIRRESKELYFYVDGKLKRTFKVATGQASYPTPLGRWTVVNMQRNPWWYPPQSSDWARGKEPVPPGPGNPLGTRWMGLSAPLVGIHGTPDSASIGYSASHGCIRMLIPQVEWLFERVELGTPVFIIPA